MGLDEKKRFYSFKVVLKIKIISFGMISIVLRIFKPEGSTDFEHVNEIIVESLKQKSIELISAVNERIIV